MHHTLMHLVQPRITQEGSCNLDMQALAMWLDCKPVLAERSCLAALMGLEMPLVPVLARMERAGVGVNPTHLAQQLVRCPLTR